MTHRTCFAPTLLLLTLMNLSCEETQPSKLTTTSPLASSPEPARPLSANVPDLDQIPNWTSTRSHEGPPSTGELFLVTPRWSPDGSHVLASGSSGNGFFVLNDKMDEVVAADPTFLGRASWGSAQTICLTEQSGVSSMIPLEVVHDKIEHEARCDTDDWDEARSGRVLFRGAQHAIYHDGYRGLTWIEFGDGTQEIVEDNGAWDVEVSPDGRRVAYCLGHLRSPALFVYDFETGRRRVGVGAQPAWFPDSRFLVFASPTAWERAGAVAVPTQSDLFLFDVQSDRPRLLAQTPQIAEMEPEVSSTGDAVVFSDWRSGALWVAPVVWRKP